MTDETAAPPPPKEPPKLDACIMEVMMNYWGMFGPRDRDGTAIFPTDISVVCLTNLIGHIIGQGPDREFRRRMWALAFEGLEQVRKAQGKANATGKPQIILPPGVRQQ